MKKVLGCLALSMVFSSAVALGAPQTDFEQGKTSVDLGFVRTEVDGLDKKTGLDFGVTTGLNEKFALQYKFQKLEGDWSDSFEKLDSDNKVHELNVLYKLDPNVYAFAGIQRLSGDITATVYGSGSGTDKIDSKTVAQIGVTGVAQLADKLNGWATAAIGNDNYSYEIGLGYEIAKNADLNLFYRYKKFNDVEFKGIGQSVDAKSKGFGAGVTFKF
ncbi:MAG: outer membrane beta-barrel protein [Sporomusaceae bacterium]|nr:outer membrane beta-barrel protein [Sporomusaceae bacterium]